jgi:outer membrane protein assembly factor BamB
MTDTPPTSDTLSEAAAHQPRLRLWPAILLTLLALAFIAFHWLRDEPLRQMRVMGTIFTLLLYGLLMFNWLIFFSRLPGRIRLRLFVVFLLLATLGGALFRIQGVSGDFIPIITFRYKAATTAPVVQTETTSALTQLPGLADYPQFLGPDRLATLPNTHINPDWQSNPPKEIWRIPIGAGWSAFAIAGDRALTMEQHGDNEAVTCYEAATGELLWIHTYPASFYELIAGPGPRATPTVHEDRVYTVGATGVLNCLDLYTGRALWTTNILEDADSKIIKWGHAGSPLIHGDLVIVNPGGKDDHATAAYHKETGEKIWHAFSADSSYGSPLLANLAGAPQILIQHNQSISSHDPTSGDVLWSIPWKGEWPKVTQPLAIAPDQLLLSSGYGKGAALYQIEKNSMGDLTPKKLWDNIRLKSKFANIVQLDSHVYGLDDGILTCLETATGQRIWKGGRYGHGQIILADQHLLIMTEYGDLVLVNATPESHQEVAKLKVLYGKTWNPHALAGEYLFVRHDNEAACYKLTMLEPMPLAASQ